jgi:hypothetical protein
MPLSCWPTSASCLIAASPKTVVGAEWSGQCESEGAAWHPQSDMAPHPAQTWARSLGARMGSWPPRWIPVGTEPYRALLGILLVWQAMITWRLQSQAVPEPSATSMRFRYPGLPLAPLMLPPSQQAAVSALVQAASGLVLAAGKWTVSASCASLAVLVHLLLLDQSLYQNHYWLLCSVLLCFTVTAHRPRTLLALLRFTHGLPYVFGALAKLTVDWLVRQEPARQWCGRMRGLSWLPGPLLAWCPAAMSIGGLAVDALMVPLLLLPTRYRTWAHLLALAFHLSNALLFHIGIFPFLMLASHLLWMEPALDPRPAVDPSRPLTEQHAGAPYRSSQPTQSVQRSGHSRARHRGRTARLHAPVEAVADDGPPKHARGRPPSRSLADVGVAAFCTCFVLFHLTWPLRRWVLYDGASLWTQEGYFGAWQMKQASAAQPVTNLPTPPPPVGLPNAILWVPPCPADATGRARHPRLPTAGTFRRGVCDVAGCYLWHPAARPARHRAGAADRPRPHASPARLCHAPSRAPAVCSPARQHPLRHWQQHAAPYWVCRVVLLAQRPGIAAAVSVRRGLAAHRRSGHVRVARS